MPQPSNEERQQLVLLHGESGLVAAAKRLGLNHMTFQRALVGLEVRHSSLRKLRAGLAKLGAEQASAAPAPASTRESA